MEVDDDDSSLTVNVGDYTFGAPSDDGHDFEAQQAEYASNRIMTRRQRMRQMEQRLAERVAREEEERQRLRQIILEQERQAQFRYDRRRQAARQAAEVTEERDNILRKVRYKIGFHVDTWPPKAVSSRLFVRAIPDITDEDRIFLTADQVRKFLARKRYVPEEDDDSIVIVAESDTVVKRIARMMEMRNRKTIALTNFDLRINCQAWVENHIRKFTSGEFEIFVCTIDLEDYNLIPFGKFTIFNKLVEQDIFNSFVTRQSERSRLKKETSIIDVTLSLRDDVLVVGNVADLMYMREEYPREDMLQFFESHCWRNRPMERRVHDQWQASEAICIQRETEELLTKIGEFQEMWWENQEILAKVQQYVTPTKEIKCHIRAPQQRLSPSCVMNCPEYQRWVREDPSRSNNGSSQAPYAQIEIDDPVLQRPPTPETPPYLFRPLQDEPSTSNIPNARRH